MTQENLQNAYDSLKRLHDATNSTIRRLENENFTLQRQVEIFSAGSRQHIESKISQDSIIQQTLSLKNSEIEQLQQRVQELKEENRALKNRKY